jgi:hypothetical protein
MMAMSVSIAYLLAQGRAALRGHSFTPNWKEHPPEQGLILAEFVVCPVWNKHMMFIDRQLGFVSKTISRMIHRRRAQ